MIFLFYFHGFIICITIAVQGGKMTTDSVLKNAPVNVILRYPADNSSVGNHGDFRFFLALIEVLL